MNATPVSKEEARLLAIEYGIRETARKTGINANTLLSWSKRYAWFAQPASVIKQNGNAISAIKPTGTIVLEDLAEHERDTKLSLARYARKAAQDNEKAGIEQASAMHKVGQLAGLVYKWGEQGKTGNQFTLNVLNINSLAIDQEQTLD